MSENNPSGIPQRHNSGKTLASDTGHKRTRIARAQAMPNRTNFASRNNASQKVVLCRYSLTTIGAADTVGANRVAQGFSRGYTEWIFRLSWSSRTSTIRSSQPVTTECEKQSSPEWRGTKSCADATTLTNKSSASPNQTIQYWKIIVERSHIIFSLWCGARKRQNSGQPKRREREREREGDGTRKLICPNERGVR